jgi:acyl-CoA thioester hydrolase
MIELARHSVQPWECDRNDHLNMQFYIGRASDALAALAIRLGHGPTELARANLWLGETEMHVRFQRELRDGAPYVLKGGVVEASPEKLVAFFEAINVATGEVSATFTSIAELRDLRDFSHRPFDDAALLKAKAVPASVPVHAMPRGLSLAPARRNPTLTEAERLRLLPSYQGIAQAWECDASGRLLSQTYMAHVFKALPHIFVQLRAGEGLRDGKRSGAAVEYRLVFRSRPKTGAALAMRSGMSAVGEKTFNHIHWLFDVESGACVGGMEAVSIGFDLETRKAIALSPEMQERYKKLVIRDLTI